MTAVVGPQAQLTELPRVHVLACGVLATDLRALVPRIAARITLDLLPGKLHERPLDLRHRLQERIDTVSAGGSADRIVIAYGLCGRGTVGLHARAVPLHIPRVHDCIALFLGSDAAYREQFARFPGTYYVSAGWVAEGMGCGQLCAAPDEQEWASRHGRENATAIADFMGSWRRNYQRAAFIDTGVGDTHHARIAEDLARANGWTYESLQGSHAVLEALLSAADDPQVLRVPPGFTTAFDAAARRLVACAPAVERPPAPAPRQSATRAARTALPVQGFGLGVDAGGTYTDVAVFDWSTRRVVAKAKAPTSHWDYAVGIEQALAALPAATLAAVTRVAVSTTLATNAIVEGKGQRVGLLLMPPEGGEPERVHHRPWQIVRGRLSIDGRELEPVDVAEAVRAAQDMIAHQQVKAFAVTGYASHVNPEHELAVMAAVRDATGLPVTCGHEVSSILNYRVRAETAALNARIIPCLQALMLRLADCLRRRGVGAPLMVVRSDGTLMNLATALERPVETLLSGPAASVAGARFLCELPDALVFDIGGTTSDTAVLHDGQVRTDPDGATVGHWRTHVRALAVRTLGLGGDSEVRRDRHGLHVGPQRVTPICRLGETVGAEAAAACLAWLDANRDVAVDSEQLAVYAGPFGEVPADLSLRHREVLDLLAKGPCTVRQLIDATGCLRPAFLDLGPLMERQLVRRFAFTPTDALHVLGRMRLWNADLARAYAAILGGVLGMDADAFARDVEERVVGRAARELLLTRLADLDAGQGVDGDHGAVARALLDRGLGVTRDGLGVQFHLGVPVIGIGAPAAFFLPVASECLGTEVLLPQDGDVANAIGAITSRVRVERRAVIVVDEKGDYHAQGLAGAPVFGMLQAAEMYAEQALRVAVVELARKAGADDPVVRVESVDRVTRTADGHELFLGRTVVAVAEGQPSGPVG